MNPRIKELHLKAGFWASEQLPFTNPEWVELRDEKFAELIVRECIDEIKNLRRNYDTNQDVEPEENDWYVDALLQAEVRLKEHFGM